MVKALTDEIMVRTGTAHFDLDLAQTAARCREFLARGIYTVFLAVDEDAQKIAGFAALCESHALYAQGAFGIIQEFYVEPPAVRADAAGSCSTRLPRMRSRARRLA